MNFSSGTHAQTHVVAHLFVIVTNQVTTSEIVGHGCVVVEEKLIVPNPVQVDRRPRGSKRLSEENRKDSQTDAIT